MGRDRKVKLALDRKAASQWAYYPEDQTWVGVDHGGPAMLATATSYRRVVNPATVTVDGEPLHPTARLSDYALEYFGVGSWSELAGFACGRGLSPTHSNTDKCLDNLVDTWNEYEQTTATHTIMCGFAVVAKAYRQEAVVSSDEEERRRCIRSRFW